MYEGWFTGFYPGLKASLETAGVSIEVDPERAQIVKRQKIDGREYLMIPIETGTEVSGVSVKKYK